MLAYVPADFSTAMGLIDVSLVAAGLELARSSARTSGEMMLGSFSSRHSEQQSRMQSTTNESGSVAVQALKDIRVLQPACGSYEQCSPILPQKRKLVSAVVSRPTSILPILTRRSPLRSRGYAAQSFSEELVLFLFDSLDQQPGPWCLVAVRTGGSASWDKEGQQKPDFIPAMGQTQQA